MSLQKLGFAYFLFVCLWITGILFFYVNGVLAAFNIHVCTGLASLFPPLGLAEGIAKVFFGYDIAAEFAKHAGWTK